MMVTIYYINGDTIGDFLIDKTQGAMRSCREHFLSHGIAAKHLDVHDPAYYASADVSRLQSFKTTWVVSSCQRSKSTKHSLYGMLPMAAVCNRFFNGAMVHLLIKLLIGRM